MIVPPPPSPTATLISPAQRAAASTTLAALGREFAALGLLPATSGNLSLRLGEDHALMTRSGVEKGQLGPADFLLAHLDSPAPAGASAEAPLHLALYRREHSVGCVLHVHSRAAAVLSRLALADGRLALQGWELQKAIAGQRSHEDELSIPVFANDQDTVRLAAVVDQALAAWPATRAYLLAGHGLYAWGRDAVEARRHLVALEVLLQSELDLRMAR